jgi:SH3-like domain-containing protein
MTIWQRTTGLALALALALAGMAAAQDVRPKPRPEGLGGAVAVAAPAPLSLIGPAAPPPAAAAPATPARAAAAAPVRDPSRGAVTNLPLPRFVSLKSREGNARRGPGLTHRIDWVFTRSGMPLRITAEHEHWRRVEDAEGAGGWVHYALLSGERTVLVTQDMAELRRAPRGDAPVTAQVETGVVAQVVQCQPEWCRINAEGQRGWIAKSALWGVEATEVID